MENKMQMALTPGFHPQKENRKNKKFLCPRWRLYWGFQHPDRQMPGQLLRADGSFDSLISQRFWWLCSYSSQRETICLLVGGKAHHQQVVVTENEIQPKSQVSHFHNLCKATWPGKPLAQPSQEREPHFRFTSCTLWDLTEPWYSKRFYSGLFQGVQMPWDGSFT